MFQGTFQEVPRKFQECFKKVSMVFQESYIVLKGVSRKIEGCCNGVSVVSRMFQGRLKVVSS